MPNLASFILIGGVLWGLWVLLWREPSWLVILVGGLFPLGLWLARRTGRVALAFPSSVLRMDLWALFFGLVAWRVALAVVRTAWDSLTGSFQPGVVAIPLQLRTEMAQLLLLWAITVTPGTIALLLEGDVLYVHCLRLSASPHIPGVDRLQQILARIWG